MQWFVSVLYSSRLCGEVSKFRHFSCLCQSFMGDGESLLFKSARLIQKSSLSEEINWSVPTFSENELLRKTGVEGILKEQERIFSSSILQGDRGGHRSVYAKCFAFLNPTSECCNSPSTAPSRKEKGRNK